MLTPWAGSRVPVAEFCMLLPDNAVDPISAPMANHAIIIPLLGCSAAGEFEGELPCDGNSSIRRTANTLASEGDQRSLSDFHILEAKLLIASAFDS